MKNKHQINQKLILIILFVNLLFCGKGFAQITGSLFMLPDNFYAQMYNPSYMRTDKAIEISIGGLGGFSFINQGNFKISDLITTTSSGNPELDFDNFYENINTNNFIRQDFSVPMAYLSIPTKNGVLSCYYKENFNSVIKFKNDIFEFLTNGNFAPEYSDFNSDEIQLLSVGYREFAFGYAKNLNKKFNVGVRAKLLFGAAFVKTDKWNYGIETSSKGDIVTLISGGEGQLMLPVPVVLGDNNRIVGINGDNAVWKYLKTYQNPGLAIDLGITYYIDEKSLFSASIRDLGAIWYRFNSMNMKQNEKYDFVGFDLISAVRYPEESGYTDPQLLVRLVKDSIGLVYQPISEEVDFISNLAFKTVLHYQYQFSDKYSFGITNQSAFQKNNFQNILTVSALQSWPNLSVFENVNLHGASDVSIGGGIQYEGDFFQAFLATDNLIAFYHPANNKTFSVTAGICILLNHKKAGNPENDKNDKGIKKRKGKISPDLPYYKHLREL